MRKEKGAEILKNINRYMIAKKLTHNKLANFLGISDQLLYGYMKRFERGEEMGLIALSHFNDIISTDLLTEYFEEV